MAIKYNTRMGNLALNTKAAQKRDIVLKPKLKGMKCSHCDTDSEFSFHQHTGYIGSSSVDWEFNACCSDFRSKVYEKLGVSR